MECIRGLKSIWGWVVLCAATVLFVVFCNLHISASLCFWDHLHEQSSALAAWVAAIGTLGLGFGLWQTSLAMKRSERSSAFRLMHERFNAPDMLYARSFFARACLERKKNGTYRDNKTLPGWGLLYFLNQLGYLVQKRRVDLLDVALAYSDHVMLIGNRWNEIIASNGNEKRFSPFFELHKRIKDLKIPRQFENELDEHYDDEFWRCEKSLANADERSF